MADQYTRILALRKGEDLFSGILRFAEDACIDSAIIAGIGAVMDPEIGVYQSPTQGYKKQAFQGLYELLTMAGNITLFEGQRFAHLHVTLAGEDYRVVGGHLFSATVGPTVEVAVTPLVGPVHRKMDPEIGIGLVV